MPDRARAAARAGVAAVAFLTVLPIGRWVRVDGPDVARATPLLPLVGALLGAAAGSVAWLASAGTGPAVAAVLAVALLAVVTGALHLDGLADTADGFGGRTREDRLRIMRDHAVGAYGVVALVLALLLKASAAASLAGRVDVVAAWVAAGALSRAVGPALAATQPYVQRPGGSGSVLHGGRARVRAVGAAAIGSALAVAMLGRTAAPAVVAAVGIAVLVAAVGRRMLGGVTGDLLGAATELAEVAVLITVAGALR
ncbi:MAG TPA: adenosylcobinamide-GDP ribazoletransferase [Mycobacteriales bacterium]